MLQAIRDKAQGWIAWVIVILISIPFALWGIQEYLGVGGEPEVAVIEGEAITERMLDQRVRDFRENLRYSLGEAYSPDLFEDSVLRPQVLDAMVEEIVLTGAAQDWNLRTAPAQARAFIASIPVFQRDGRFDTQLYEATVRNRGIGPAEFEQGVLRDLAVEQLRTGVRDSALVTESEVAERVRLLREQRVVRYLTIPAERHRGEVVVEEGALRAYYQENLERYRTPERVKISYLLLDSSELGRLVEVEEGSLRRYFDDHRAEFVGLQERAVSHILLSVPPGSDAAGEAEIRQKAEALLAELRTGAAFADLAREHSEDPGSAAMGGDLGWVEPGIMVPAFEEAAFALEPGTVSEPVRTEFGYHLIQVTDVRGGSGADFDAVRDRVEASYRAFEAESLYFDYAERLAETAYEHSDSLVPAAEALGLDVQTTDWIARDNAFPAPLTSPRVAAAVFSDDVLIERHNSELIEIGPQQAVVVRISEHEPSGILPFDGNKPAIEADYVREQSAQRAAAAGAAYLERMQRGETTLGALAEAGAYSLYEPGAVGRGQGDVPAEVLRLAFTMAPPQPGSPAYAGTPSRAGDYQLVELSAVEPGQLGAMTTAERERFMGQIRDELGETELESITRNLRNQAKVELTQKKTDTP